MISVSLLLAAAAAQPVGPVPRNLIDIKLFDGSLPTHTLAQEGGFYIDKDAQGRLPLDTLETWQDHPSLRILTSGQGKSWTVTFAGPNWITYDLSSYWQNGSLELTIKGRDGGESFKVALADRDPIRRSSTVFSQALTLPGKDWTTIEIPLRRLIPDPGPFRLRQTAELRFTGTQEASFYIGSIRFTSPDKEPTALPIKANQVGYEPSWTKKAIVSSFDGEASFKAGTPFKVLDIRDKTVFQGTLKPLAELDSASGERLFTADFTPLRQTGSFRIVVEGAGDSTVFEIRPSLYSGLLRDLTRYYYFQRSGVALSSAHAGIWSRLAGHQGDSSLPYQSGKPGTRDASGGWYDAGDYGKYVPTAARAVTDLLWTYEYFPALFADGQLGIPESGNGVPDILDEAKWCLDWILRMQDESGAFYHKVWPSISDQMPSQDKARRLIYDKGRNGASLLPTAGTANASAALAHASLTFAKVRPEFADLCRAASLKAWNWLEKTPQEIPAEGMTYVEEGDLDNRLWAAFVLYRLTGEERFHASIKKLVKTFDSGWTDDKGNANSDLTMMAWPHYFRSAKQDPELTSWHRRMALAFREIQMKRWRQLHWGNFLLDQNYYWSSNASTAQTVQVLYANGKVHGFNEADLLQAAIRNHDYLLGANPLRTSYVSGAGEASIKNTYSQIFNNDRLEQVPPGYLSGGPNKYQGSFNSRWPAKCHRDVCSDWVTQEHCITYNSPMVFATAYLLDSARRRN